MTEKPYDDIGELAEAIKSFVTEFNTDNPLLNQIILEEIFKELFNIKEDNNGNTDI